MITRQAAEMRPPEFDPGIQRLGRDLLPKGPSKAMDPRSFWEGRAVPLGGLPEEAVRPVGEGDGLVAWLRHGLVYVSAIGNAFRVPSDVGLKRLQSGKLLEVIIILY